MYYTTLFVHEATNFYLLQLMLDYFLSWHVTLFHYYWTDNCCCQNHLCTFLAVDIIITLHIYYLQFVLTNYILDVCL